MRQRFLAGWLLLAGASADATAAATPPEHPVGNGASVTLVSRQHTSGLRNPVVSTFRVQLAPGGSAVLHRAPSSGYVLVHVVSGAIAMRAWEAEVGISHAGETWIEPAFAHDISVVNASAAKSAEAVVLVIAEDTHSVSPPPRAR